MQRQIMRTSESHTAGLRRWSARTSRYAAPLLAVVCLLAIRANALQSANVSLFARDVAFPSKAGPLRVEQNSVTEDVDARTAASEGSGIIKVNTDPVGETFTPQVSLNPVSGNPITLQASETSFLQVWASNTGTVTASFTFDRGCWGDGLDLGTCGISPDVYTLAPGQGVTLYIGIKGAVTGGTGYVVVKAYETQNMGTLLATLTTMVNVTPPVVLEPITGSPIALQPSEVRFFQLRARNTGAVTTNFTFNRSCSGGGLDLGTCGISPDVYTLAPAQAVTLEVGMKGSAAGGTGTIVVQAFKTQDMGTALATLTTTINTTAPAPPPVASFDVLTFRGGTTIERGLCPTLAIVSDVASQCGALRISHSLPATTTYGKTSAPTLAYYSDHVAGPQILAKVALNGAAAPDSVEVNTYELDANGNRLGSAPLLAAKFTGVNWAASSTQRFNTGVLWSDPARPTGIYRFDVEVRLKAPGGAWYNAGQAQRGRVAWVNRRGSPFGDGWWMLGLEELYTQGDTVLWVGGDGSTRRYVKAQTGGGTVFIAPSVTRPDTLYRIASNQWRRVLPGRVNVYFDSTGRHIKTTDRYNRSTDFTYEAGATARGRLKTITLPAAQTYTVNYFPSAIAVNSPGSRQTVITLSSTQLKGIESIRDPDLSLISFGYYGWGVGYAINSRTDRRGTTTSLTWDDYAGTLKQASTPATATQTVVQSIVSPRGQGAYRGASVQAVAAAEPDYEFNGPRTDVSDVTKIWVDSLGAPRKITDAVGLTTTVERSPVFPGLPDLIVHPGGYAERSFFDAGGHVESMVALNPYDDGRNAWTRYTWDPWSDRITSMTGPDGETTIFGIDPATGSVISEQRAQVAGSRVDYTYHPSLHGLITSVRTPIPGGGVSTDSLEYDALGNLSRMISPRGRIARFVRDGIGRVTSDTTYLTASSSGPKRVRSTQFDLMDRPFIQVDSAGTDALEVRTFYNAAGAVDSVHQRARPVRVARDTGAADAPIRRSYRYDLLGRKLFEHVGLAAEASWRYDLAGNVVASSKEPGDSLVYDAINRLVQRIGGPDAASYSYDALGNLQEATNAFARIRRSYYRNGALRGDTTSVANSALTGFGSTDGFAVQYDLTGRRSAIQMPAGIDGRTISYTYDNGASGTGQVATITDGFSGVGNSFQYDALGRPSIITRRANTAQPIVETRAYDLESNDSVRTIVGGSTTYLNELVSRDLLNRIVKAGADTNAYDGLGHAVYATNGLYPAASASIIHYDAFGNRVDYKSIGAVSDERRYIFQGGFNRPAKEWTVGFQPDTTRYVYGADGALAIQETPHLFAFDGPYLQNDSGFVLTDRINQYRGGKMVSSEWVRDTSWIFRSSMQPQPSAYRNIETYRYDALGRRVWQRMVYPDQRCDQTEYESGCQSTITTTVWDGSDILLERRTPSDTGYNGATSINPYGVVAYVPGFEIDRPFLVLKQGDHDVLPFTNTIGRIMKGACSGTPCAATDVDFPMGRADVYGRPYSLRDRSNWFGSLIQGMTDGSGYIYQRNRYLNPSNGTFTQVDPIGLAGGLNVYGFANGDPITYSDPFGLCVLNLPCPRGFVNAVAGFGDGASFGLSGWIRRNTPGGDGVDYGSGAYVGGEIAGTVATIVATSGAAGEASAAEAGEVAETTTTRTVTRAAPGRDGGTSRHLIEQEADGTTRSVTHQVERNGEIVHQHQAHVGKYGGRRVFADEWNKYPKIDKP